MTIREPGDETHGDCGEYAVFERGWRDSTTHGRMVEVLYRVAGHGSTVCCGEIETRPFGNLFPGVGAQPLITFLLNAHAKT